MPLLDLYVENSVLESALNTGINGTNTQPCVTNQTWEKWFNQWLEMLLDFLPTASSYEIGLRLTDDGEIQQMNHQYRQINQPTDVLAFATIDANLPQSEEIAAAIPLYLGDIVLSVDTAKRQAEVQGHSLSTELAWLAAHGLLHLLGWDHPDDKTLGEMLKQQVLLLQKVEIEIEIEIE